MMSRGIAAALLCCTFLAVPAAAQDKLTIKYTTASVPSDLHTKAMQVFKEELEKKVPGRFDVQLYDSGTLFAQGADLDALQRGNAEMTYLSFQLIADNLPQYSVLTAGYLFQNAKHYRTFLNSDLGVELKEAVSSDMDVQLLDTCYLGTRELNLRAEKEVNTPDDLKGVKLRMPGSDAWLFLGQALGASPTPLPFGEVYLGLQTGTIDAQDNPLPTVEAAKFYEVTKQITLTDHLVDGLNIAVNNKTWEKLSDSEKTAMTEAAQASCDWNNENRYKEEARLIDFFKEKGLKVTKPDVAAFRKHVQDFYFNSDRSKNWPEGWVEKINAMAE
ncbi:sialic acid TRAP transporter substrate-binding protein SiaP [Cohaesibacter haloalkalitolerans]|uniref:sialic acid TRAP transporter substrate-binding protein SiaP n=1 Tax=Cohaesibacter haloalkalitolerans TaxID=1162980 RepID=UPI000E65AEEB|nr:sialic acid TRAP transporter substrate-binding protein SiaP [Cohaesibacter haloalkalitolerans]